MTDFFPHLFWLNKRRFWPKYLQITRKHTHTHCHIIHIIWYIIYIYTQIYRYTLILSSFFHPSSQLLLGISRSLTFRQLHWGPILVFSMMDPSKYGNKWVVIWHGKFVKKNHGVLLKASFLSSKTYLLSKVSFWRFPLFTFRVWRVGTSRTSNTLPTYSARKSAY